MSRAISNFAVEFSGDGMVLSRPLPGHFLAKIGLKMTSLL